jgi:hypothetical protein
MPDSAFAAWLLLGAWLACIAGMGWLALSMQAHALQVWGAIPSRATTRVLRVLGALGLAIALSLCLMADHASMAVLVWVMTLASAALLTAFTFTWRARWLRVLAPWVRIRSMKSR